MPPVNFFSYKGETLYLSLNTSNWRSKYTKKIHYNLLAVTNKTNICKKKTPKNCLPVNVLKYDPTIFVKEEKNCCILSMFWAILRNLRKQYKIKY